ncbi:monovalent cation/H(+) antiporter subunit G [Thioalkalivibrio sp. XN8]|uniref:monovalent cation/H(+) antiporter subunit G n=1 Tax=Thioalkalivibrio sp. XN8 TaxID=2712863 RepID=UPI0013EA3AE4|nr:monovalent cation/H(+) antiporter subunit G [Thioalkalivibrio sp. XN8]NGP52679.1 monovalent cation/H(+) antiporter subunit G [Thioalkalivibrio sp. XN8]
MTAVWHAIVVALALFGAAFFLAGTLGLLRLPDFYTRAHAVSKCDTVGAGSILLALALYVAPQPEALKILLLLLLVLLSSPTSCHALAHAAHHTGLEPREPRAGEPS